MNKMTKKTSRTEATSSAKATTYASKFTIASNKCAENVLEMCKIVYEAKSDLGSGEFEFFCQQISLKSAGSAISKMKTIGEAYSKLAAYKNELPGAWTTLYLISRMTPEDFKRAHEEKVINPMTTAKQLKSYAPYLFKDKIGGDMKTVDSSDNNTLFSIKSITDVASDKFEEFKNKLLKLCNEYKCELAEQEV